MRIWLYLGQENCCLVHFLFSNEKFTIHEFGLVDFCVYDALMNKNKNSSSGFYHIFITRSFNGVFFYVSWLSRLIIEKTNFIELFSYLTLVRHGNWKHFPHSNLANHREKFTREKLNCLSIKQMKRENSNLWKRNYWKHEQKCNVSDNVQRQTEWAAGKFPRLFA